jgi:dolichol-phosphate mannosyltransferase
MAAAAPQQESTIQIIVPIYNEGENVIKLCKSLSDEKVPFDRLTFVYDLDTDTTLPFIERLHQEDPRIGADKNCFGRGVCNALKWGFSRALPGPVLVVMGDNSDKLSVIPEMIEMWRRGATVVSPSRYMPGGKMHGGPLLKGLMSRAAGISLRLLGFPTSDPTNNFKLYDGEWLKGQTIESVGGFEVALELCYKAYDQKLLINQLPSEWWDRTMGESRFKLAAWLPRYLKWYFKTISVLLTSGLWFASKGRSRLMSPH